MENKTVNGVVRWTLTINTNDTIRKQNNMVKRLKKAIK